MNWLVEEFKKQTGIDLSQDKMAEQRLKDAAEKAKIELSTVMSTNINLPFITADASGPKHLDLTLTRAKFNELTSDLVHATMEPTRQAIKDSGLSIDEIDKIILVGGSSRIPAVQEAIKNILGKDPDKGINPDECVAIGAAIQAGVLVGDVKDVLLLDVTPLSLGIETMGGIFTKIIERNTTIPTEGKQIFSTAMDNQPSVDVHVLQGEREMAADNKTLGRFELSGIPAAPRGVPRIEVAFNIDANGIVNVSAKDLGTGKEQKITITYSSGLDQSEIDRMVKEAAAHEVKDKIAALKEALKSEDTEQIKAASEALTKPLYDLTGDMYKQAEAQQQAQQSSGQEQAQESTSAGDDNVVDADYQVVDDDKK